MPSPHLKLDRTLGPESVPRTVFLRAGTAASARGWVIAHRISAVATTLALAIVTLGACAGTTPKPPAQPSASRAPGPCWLLSIEEVTNNTLEQQGDMMQLVATYRFGAEHEAGGAEHAPFELSSRTTRWRANEWPDRLDTHPVALCTPEAMQAPDRVNGEISPTH